jgi:membrane-anchored glycerophosphoryl diester phosphodiesterase (GDPDase)
VLFLSLSFFLSLFHTILFGCVVFVGLSLSLAFSAPLTLSNSQRLARAKKRKSKKRTRKKIRKRHRDCAGWSACDKIIYFCCTVHELLRLCLCNVLFISLFP